jgi:hypothetical protein
MDLDKKLKQEETKGKLKEIGKITASVIVGIGTAYACDKLGISSFSWKNQTIASPIIFGEFGKNLSNFLYNYGGRVLIDTTFGIAGSMGAYIGLNKLIK